MVQAAELIVQQTTIRTAKGRLTGRFQRIPETNILSLIERFAPEEVLYAPGTVFIPNHQLAEESDGQVEVMAYPGGLYEALRGRMHTLHGGGAAVQATRGELPALVADRATALYCVEVLLAYNHLTPSVKKDALALQEKLVRAYAFVRNEHKQTARDRFRRGSLLTDSLGRTNPMAAAMAMGGGIGDLKAREQEILRIASRVDDQAVQLWAGIRSILHLYDELANELQTRRSHPVRVRGMGEQRIGLLELLLEDGRGPGAMPRTASMLREFADAFGYVKAQPFRANAELMQQELLDAAAFATNGDREKLREQYRTIRCDVSWVHLQRALEINVIGPLSFLLTELQEGRRHERRGQVRTRDLQRVSRDMAPKAFERINQAFAHFHHAFNRASDTYARSFIKVSISERLSIASDYAAADDWQKVKELLKEVSTRLSSRV